MQEQKHLIQDMFSAVHGIIKSAGGRWGVVEQATRPELAQRSKTSLSFSSQTEVALMHGEFYLEIAMT